MVVRYTPARGDVVWLNFDPQHGKEIKKTRPALTISPEKYNSKTGLALFMPITSKSKSYPFEIDIRCGGVDGVILCDQIRSLDWQTRKAAFIGKISDDVLANVIDKFKLLID